jgi:hypothetical protein
MRNPSPKARHFIEVGIGELQKPEIMDPWKTWSREHPFRRIEGSVNQATELLPDRIAKIAVSGLDALAKDISERLKDTSLAREAIIALKNDLGYIQDIETELLQDLRARV